MSVDNILVPSVEEERGCISKPQDDQAQFPLVTLADVESASDLLEPVAEFTPVQPSRRLSELIGHPVWLKLENLQRAGSFKIRGAYNRMARLSPDEKA